MIITDKSRLARINGVFTAKHAGVQGMYYGSLAPVSAFASAFLLFRGFTNSQIGVVTALGAIGSAILQMAIGNLASHQKFSIRASTVAALAVLIALSLVLCIAPLGTTVTAAVYVAILVVALSLQPLVSSMSFLYQSQGIEINFGVARAAGSVVYAILCPIIGLAVTLYSGAAIPWFNCLAFGGMLLFVIGFHPPKAAWGAQPLYSGEAISARTVPQEEGTPGFFRRNQGYLPFLIGTALLFLNLAATQSYFLQIIRSKGGDIAGLGIVASIGAAMEIPMMVGFAWLNSKAKCSFLIQASALFFTLKTVGILLASNVTGLYFAQILHMFGYAMFTPASVYYVDKLMGEGDKVKGQAYLGSTMVAGSVAANFAGGRILDVWGPNAMLLCAVTLSAAGSVILIQAVSTMRKSESRL